MIYFLTFLILRISLLAITVKAIGCYRCCSANGSNRDCEDSFNSTMELYEDSCLAARLNRHGLFPGQYCYKIKGTTMDDTIIIRDCSVLNMQNMCGQFEYEEKIWNGCIQTCKADGCNYSKRDIYSWLVIALGLATVPLYHQYY